MAAPWVIRASWPPPTIPTTGKPAGDPRERDTGSGTVRRAGTVRTLPVETGNLDGWCAFAGGHGRDDERVGVGVSGIFAAVTGLRGSLGVVDREIAKFGAVGAIAFVVNVGLFNLLSAGPLDGHEKLSLTIASGVSIVVAWFGSRYWTFRHREQTSRAPFLTFVLMNVIGAGIAVVCLAISHDLLGFHSRLADNISGNVIGVGLGTLFRFWAYRTFVFTEFIDPEGRDRAEDPEAEPLPEPAAEHPSTPAPVVPEAPPARAQGPVPLDERRLAGAAATPATGLHLDRGDVPRRAAG